MSKKHIIIIVVILLAMVCVVDGIFNFFVKKIENNVNESENVVEGNLDTEKNQNSVEDSLEDIMTKLYAGINEENLPMGLSNMEVTSENVESFIGTSNVKYTEALANESMVGSIAHSVVLVRLEDSQDPATAVEEIKNNVDPRKWICIEASNVVVKNKGNLVVLIMSNEELAPKLEANFDNL